jgi:hypothetical protein
MPPIILSIGTLVNRSGTFYAVTGPNNQLTQLTDEEVSFYRELNLLPVEYGTDPSDPKAETHNPAIRLDKEPWLLFLTRDQREARNLPTVHFSHGQGQTQGQTSNQVTVTVTGHHWEPILTTESGSGSGPSSGSITMERKVITEPVTVYIGSNSSPIVQYWMSYIGKTY